MLQKYSILRSPSAKGPPSLLVAFHCITTLLFFHRKRLLLSGYIKSETLGLRHPLLSNLTWVCGKVIVTAQTESFHLIRKRVSSHYHKRKTTMWEFQNHEQGYFVQISKDFTTLDFRTFCTFCCQAIFLRLSVGMSRIFSVAC